MMSNHFNIILFLVPIISVLCLGSAIDAPSCGEYSLGYEFSNKTGQCYKYHGLEVTWTKATWICAGESARLAAPSNREENEILQELIKRHPHLSNQYVAIGIYWDDGWKTVEGLNLEQADFTTPAVASHKIVFEAYDRKNTTLHNLDTASSKQPFICEKAPVPTCY